MSIFRRQAAVIRCLLLGIGLLLVLSAQAAPGHGSYTFAVVPQYAPITVHRNWQPFIRQLSLDTGVTFRLRVYNSFNRFIGALERGAVDFAYLAPFHLVQARRTQNYIPLLRDGKRDLVGIVVVRKDSPYKSIKDLNGKRIDFPSPYAFAASLYLRAYLREKLNIEYEPRYVGNHDNVYRHIALNLAEGGGGVNNTLSQQPRALQESLRVLYEVPAVASHPLSAHARVPEALRRQVITTLKAWQDDPQRQALLRAVQMEMPVEANYERDYAYLETLGLEKYLREPGK